VLAWPVFPLFASFRDLCLYEIPHPLKRDLCLLCIWFYKRQCFKPHNLLEAALVALCFFLRLAWNQPLIFELIFRKTSVDLTAIPSHVVFAQVQKMTVFNFGATFSFLSLCDDTKRQSFLTFCCVHRGVARAQWKRGPSHVVRKKECGSSKVRRLRGRLVRLLRSFCAPTMKELVCSSRVLGEVICLSVSLWWKPIPIINVTRAV